MPTVPRFDEPSVQAQNLPGVQIQAPDVGAAGRISGQQLQGLGNSLQEVGQTIQMHQINVDEANAKSDLINYMNAHRAIINDPQNGYLSKVGKAAVDAYPGVMDSLNASRDGIADNAANVRGVGVLAVLREDAGHLFADDAPDLVVQRFGFVSLEAALDQFSQREPAGFPFGGRLVVQPYARLHKASIPYGLP